VPLEGARLEGNRISFAVKEGNPSVRRYSGRVRGNVILGTANVADGAGIKWTAQRRPEK
jgi:hypothetical protein